MTRYVKSLLVYIFLCCQLVAMIAAVHAHDGDDETIELETLATFDVSIGEQPQGMTVLDNGYLAVSFPFLKELRIYHPKSGKLLNTITGLPSVTGLITDKNGDVLASALSAFFDPMNAHEHGIWRIPVDGTAATQLAAFPADSLPMHMVLTEHNNLLVSDILLGVIYHIDQQGTVSLWATDHELFGSTENQGPPGRPEFPVGIEGLQIYDDYLYGVVADHGRIVRYPINNEYAAGPVDIYLEKPNKLYGIAHFTFVDDGAMVAVSGFQSQIYRVSDDQEVTVIADKSSNVDTPAAVVRGKGKFAKDLFFTNFAFVTNNAGGDAKPSIMRLRGVFEND